MKSIQDQINEDLQLISKFFEVELFNDSKKVLMYNIKASSLGMSHTNLETLRKNGIKIFSFYPIRPIGTHSRVNIMLMRSLK
tara:strand:- start:423 stop:668 length:246 start_codon:yes stop_codon:yes gene_type:complete